MTLHGFAVKLPRNWPAIGFMILLPVITLMSLAWFADPSPPLCDKGDQSGLVCIRNWFNAAGNLLAVVVATIAATFALGSFKEAQRQSDLSSLAPLERRIEIALRLQTISRRLLVGWQRMITSSDKIYDILHQKKFDEILRSVARFNHAYNTFEKASDELQIYAHQTSMDLDLYEIANSLNKYHFEFTSLIREYNLFFPELNFDNDKFEELNKFVISTTTSNIENIRNFRSLNPETIRKINSMSMELQEIILKTHQDRSKIIASARRR